MARMDTVLRRFNIPISLPMLLGASVVFVAWGMLRLAPDSFIIPVFCRVPAELAARYYNVALQTPELIFSVRGSVFEVIRPCGATDFFSMVAGLLTYASVRLEIRPIRPIGQIGRGKWCILCPIGRIGLIGPISFLAILPLAWGITLLANAIRLIFIVPATFFVYHHFSMRAFAASHQAFGTLVFLTLFIILWEGVRYVTRNKTR